MSGLPKARWSGSFTIFGVDVRCHVLDTGERIIEADSMRSLVEALQVRPIGYDETDDMARFLRWQTGKEARP